MTMLNETSDHNRIKIHQNSEREVVAALNRRQSEIHKYIFHLDIKTWDIYLSLINIKNRGHIFVIIVAKTMTYFFRQQNIDIFKNSRDK